MPGPSAPVTASSQALSVSGPSAGSTTSQVPDGPAAGAMGSGCHVSRKRNASASDRARRLLRQADSAGITPPSASVPMSSRLASAARSSRSTAAQKSASAPSPDAARATASAGSGQ
ncbi:hypothetical protein GCM10010321_08670 [Streptomyces chartreusis]|nr:hypothetical protein GCM10010321_08670 [Streptomyces chartreusis]